MSWRVPLKQPIYTIFGANTGVGKTIFSTLLVKAFAPEITYIKPVSTGPLSDADYLHVDRYCEGVQGKVLFQFDEPCSPHIAAGIDVRAFHILAEVHRLMLTTHSRRVIPSYCRNWPPY